VAKQLQFLTADPTESSWNPLYIVAIGWLFVAIMVAVTQPSFMAGAISLLCCGVLPLGLFLWIMGTPQRRRKSESGQAADEKPNQRD
jgi:hypothetical protein